MLPRRLLSLCSTALLLAAGSAAWADEVVLVPNATVKLPGGRVRGQITAETPTQVKIQPATGAEQAIPTDQIASISYDGQPPSLALAETRENAGNFAEAADLYKKAATEAAAKPLAAQAAQFGRVRSLADLALIAPNRRQAAIEELDAFVGSHPTGRHVGAALELLIRLAIQKGDTDKAQAALKQLKDKVPSAADHAGVLEARVLVRKGEHAKALSALDAIIAATSKDKDSPRAREARLAKAECLVAQKKFDEAQATVLEVIKEAPPEAADIQGEAYNMLGDCYRAAGRPKDALNAYLNIDIFYEKNKEQHPRALAQIAQVFRELKQDGRADEIIEKLRREYPQSPYATNKPAAR